MSVKFQIINQDGKPAFVVLPIDEWRRIEEKLEDRAGAAAVRAFHEHPSETFPDSVAAALIGGAHPMKVLRDHRGMTQARLAKAAGTSSVYISQIERGDRPAGRKLLLKIAEALHVDADMLADTHVPRGYQVREVRLILRKHPGGLSAADLARETGRSRDVVEAVVRRLRDDGEVRIIGDRWRLRSK